MITSPFVHKSRSISHIMVTVMLALLPMLMASVYWFGWAIFSQIAIAAVTALAAEALMLAMMRKPLAQYCLDGSAVLTGLLIAFTFPLTVPWWLTVVGTAFAIIIAKHLYGGLGQNPFNPAMVAFAMCIVAFPTEMTHWPTPHPFNSVPATSNVTNTTNATNASNIAVDAISSATPLDHLKTSLKLQHGQSQLSQNESQNESNNLPDNKPQETNATQTGTDKAEANNRETTDNQGPTNAMKERETMSSLTSQQSNEGRSWAWLNIGALLGGLLLWQRRIITWHIPLTFIGTLFAFATIFYWLDATHYAPPLFHLFTGGTMLGAFFIATDPVTGATTPRGKIIFAAGCAALVYIIRVFGGYPDGVAFAVLFMNILVPLIDQATQPPIFGMKKHG